MKKFVFIFLCLISLFGLTACDSLKHKHIKGEWEHNELQHWQGVTCTWNKCDIDIVSEDHIDEDKDGICDVCNRKEEYIFVLNYDKTGYILSDIGPGYI